MPWLFVACSTRGNSPSWAVASNPLLGLPSQAKTPAIAPIPTSSDSNWTSHPSCQTSVITALKVSKKWLRLSEQLSPIYKWTAGGFVTVQSCPRRRSALATNRPTRWATRGAPGELILCGQRHRWQLGKVVLVGREIGKARVRSSGVVPAQVVGDVGARGAHAVVGLEVHALVLHAAPQPLDEDVVAPGAAPVHAELAALAQYHVGELGCRELAALVGVDDLGRTPADEGLLD